MLQTERIESEQEALRAALDGRQALIWTSLPGIVQSYDATKNLAEVQPVIKARVRAQDGTYKWEDRPVIPNVLVVQLSVKDFAITLPIQAGDEGLLIFASRCLDNWYLQGGLQQPKEMTMHQLTDALFLPARLSLPKLITGISASNLQLRNSAGSAYIELTAAGAINIVAPAGATINGVAIDSSGNVNTSGEGTFKTNHTVSAHTHGGVTTGVGNTGLPTG